jgi:hypothetical protein
VSDSDNRLTCDEHGESAATFVCQHLVQGQGLGFTSAHDPGEPRPHAWCSECDRILVEEGLVWTGRAEAQAGVTVICAACYDQAKARNQKAG